MGRITTPPSPVISGLAYNQFSRKLWACRGIGSDTLLAFEPETGNVVNQIPLMPTYFVRPVQGVACNGLHFVVSWTDGNDVSHMSLYTVAGNFIGEKEFPGQRVTGLTASPFSYTYVDKNNDRLVVLDPFGNEVARSAVPGSTGGSEAVAYDYLSDFDHIPKLWNSDGSVGNPGTQYHPDTDWDPPPWNFRHRIYVANQIDQIIYVGYLTEH